MVSARNAPGQRHVFERGPGLRFHLLLSGRALDKTDESFRRSRSIGLTSRYDPRHLKAGVNVFGNLLFTRR